MAFHRDYSPMAVEAVDAGRDAEASGMTIGSLTSKRTPPTPARERLAALASWRRTCLGQIVWHPRVAYGRVVAFEIGESALHIDREARVPRARDPFPPRPADRPRVHVTGRWTCWINSELWELRWRRRVVLSHQCSETRARNVLSHLQGQRLTDVRTGRGRVSILFNGGLEFRVKHAIRSSDAATALGGDVVFRAGSRELGFDAPSGAEARRERSESDDPEGSEGR